MNTAHALTVAVTCVSMVAAKLIASTTRRMSVIAGLGLKA
jgi:hypothetical protein